MFLPSSWETVGKRMAPASRSAAARESIARSFTGSARIWREFASAVRRTKTTTRTARTRPRTAKALFMNAPSLQHEHPHRRGEHQQRREADGEAGDQRARLLVHALTIRRHDQNPDEQEGREQTVDDGGPEQEPDRIDAGE